MAKSLVSRISGMPTPACLSEIFGLNRLFGFPVVDEDGSVRNIRKIASPKKQTREQAERMNHGCLDKVLHPHIHQEIRQVAPY